MLCCRCWGYRRRGVPRWGRGCLEVSQWPCETLSPFENWTGRNFNDHRAQRFPTGWNCLCWPGNPISLEPKSGDSDSVGLVVVCILRSVSDDSGTQNHWTKLLTLQTIWKEGGQAARVTSLDDGKASRAQPHNHSNYHISRAFYVPDPVMYFTCIIIFNPHNNLIEQLSSSSPFLKTCYFLLEYNNVVVVPGAQ